LSSLSSLSLFSLSARKSGWATCFVLLRRFNISLLFFATRIFLTYIQFQYLPSLMLTNRQLRQNVHLSKIKLYGISHLCMYHMVNITL
jgi:hypothetical protein